MSDDGELPVAAVETAVDGLAGRLGDFAAFLGDPSSLAIVILWTLLILFWLGSGALSSSLAERRLRAPVLHFVGGLVFPGVYPLLVLALGQPKRPVRRETAEAADVTVRLDGPPPVETEEPTAAGRTADSKAPAMVLGPQGALYNQAFFVKLCFDEAGRPRGPFNFQVEGAQIRVERIVDAMPEVAVIETLNADGKLQTLRIPYGRIESCTEI